MFLLGTIVNALGIIIGAALGMTFRNIPERLKNTVMQGLSLAVILIGLNMALSDNKHILIIIISMALGGLLGEWWNLEGWLERFGHFLEKKTAAFNQGRLGEAFVTATLIYCVGSMAIVGAIQSGASADNTTLFAKTLLDGFSAIIFTSTLGVGVLFSAIPVALYEGSIATISYFAGTVLNAPPVIACMTATGGLLIVAIGLNILGLCKLAVGNLLPAMFVAALLTWAAPHITVFMHYI